MDTNENYGSERPIGPTPSSSNTSSSLITGSIPAQSHSSNIDFTYADTDQHLNEVAELYSYSEEIDFTPNRLAFEELMEDYGYPLKWIHMSENQKHRAIERMADGIEFTDRSIRIRAIRGILYLCQGNFADCLVIDEQPRYARKNIFHLYDYGLFPTFIQLIHYEIEQAMKFPDGPPVPTNNISTASSSYSNDPNIPLRLLVNIVYLFVQEMYIECPNSDTEYHKKLRQQFKEELMQPICGELLHVTLLEMIVKHCSGLGPKNFPTRKTLLLLWKVLLLTLGGHDELLRLKNHYRQRAGLKPIPDDTLEVTKRMFPASPPPTAAEIMDSQHQRKMNRPFKRQMVVKQSSFGDESYSASTNFNDENNSPDDDILNDDAFEPPSSNGNNGNGNNNNNNNNNNNRYTNGTDSSYSSSRNNNDVIEDTTRPNSPRSSSPVPDGFRNRRVELDNLREALMISKGLPWQPKVRQKDIEQFFAQVRKKFVGYTLPDDCTTTAGLPTPILEGIKVLKKHLYQSLSELQIKREEELAKYPLTTKEFDEEAMNSFAEQLYRALLPNMQQYLITLLKLLLSSVSNLKTKNESHSALADIIPPQEPPTNAVQSIKLKIDLNRHHEIIIKAISGILILLLKHYKINHIYQFEYICQQLMFANCIPLIIKFLTQEMTEFVQSKNNIPVLDFPVCVIGEKPELTSDVIELLSETQSYSWRNMFSSINLLRILNKLTKWKNECRIVMLVIFKSAQPLKRALRVRHAMFQLYVLKLLKIQVKFLGRQWRKSNMKIMSDIYVKVRHRLNDDWAFANDVDTKSVYLQAEEFLLTANINRFHHRRYERPYPNNINSVTSQALNTGGGGPPSHLNGVRLNDNISSNGINSTMAGGPSSSLSTSVNPHDPSQNSSNVNPALAVIAEIDLLQPVDNNLLSVLSKEVKLTNKFKKNYEIWMEREVFRYQINWDDLLENPSGANIDTKFLQLISSTNNNNNKRDTTETENTKTT